MLPACGFSSLRCCFACARFVASRQPQLRRCGARLFSLSSLPLCVSCYMPADAVVTETPTFPQFKTIDRGLGLVHLHVRYGLIGPAFLILGTLMFHQPEQVTRPNLTPSRTGKSSPTVYLEGEKFRNIGQPPEDRHILQGPMFESLVSPLGVQASARHWEPR